MSKPEQTPESIPDVDPLTSSDEQSTQIKRHFPSSLGDQSPSTHKYCSFHMNNYFKFSKTKWPKSDEKHEFGGRWVRGAGRILKGGGGKSLGSLKRTYPKFIFFTDLGFILKKEK